MSRAEIMKAIEDGDRYAGILFERIEGKIDLTMEESARLDKKIDAVDAKLEDFREETNWKFEVLIGDHQKVLGEMRAMREGFEAKFVEVFKRFEQHDLGFAGIFKKFEQYDGNFEKIFKRFDRFEKAS